VAAYATVDQLEARWRPLTDTEAEKAEVLLEDASVQIRSEVPDLKVRIEAGDSDLLSAAIRVECAMVKRAMANGDDGVGVTSAQETQGPFSQTFQFANPSGDLYLTKAERRLLTSSGGQRAFTIDQGGTGVPYILDELAYARIASPNADGLSGFVA
jgi:hypothetical protein